MPEQRVSDERARKYADGGMVPSQDLAFDLLDARAILAAVRPVVAAAVKQRDANAEFDRAMVDGGDAPAIGAFIMLTDAAVDALPADVREWAKE